MTDPIEQKLASRNPVDPSLPKLRPPLSAPTGIERALSAFATKYGLSPQQAEMLVLLSAQSSNKEIARALGVAEESVREQWGRVMAKLGSADTKAREGVLSEFVRFCAGERY